MKIETYINLMTSIGTVSAVFVALGISIIPSIYKSYKNRKLSEKRIYLALTVINKAIKEYRFYNPTHYIINDGKIMYTYSPEDLKINVKIDLNREIDDILRYIDYLKHKNKLVIWPVMKELKIIISGFPQDNSVWDNLEELLNTGLNSLPIN